MTFAEQQSLLLKYRIESDETFTETIERTIDGWKQRCMKAESSLDAAMRLLAEAETALEDLGAPLSLSVMNRVVRALDRYYDPEVRDK